MTPPGEVLVRGSWLEPTLSQRPGGRGPVRGKVTFLGSPSQVLKRDASDSHETWTRRPEPFLVSGERQLRGVCEVLAATTRKFLGQPLSFLRQAF